jgi:serine/threonine protein phosphatase PrpC
VSNFVTAPFARPTRIGRVEVATAGEVGASHRQRQRGSDDAVGWCDTDGGSVLATVAIADGHSDRRCRRSRTGADFVVATAAALPDHLVGPDALADALITGWRQRVDQHLAANPPVGDDVDAMNDRMAYGTTAALCRITGDAITIVRVGDGDIIAVDADGRASRLAEPERRSGEVTESISQLDAERVVRSTTIAADVAPTLLVLATDGFDNAYPTGDSMLRAASELAQLRRESGQPIEADLLANWAREAADVSGDDATIAAIWIETTVAADSTTVPMATP